MYTFANILTLLPIFLCQNISAPPAPPLKAQTSPLANMFTQENNTSSVTTSHNNSAGIMAHNMALVFIWRLPLRLCFLKLALFKVAHRIAYSVLVIIFPRTTVFDSLRFGVR